MASLQVTTLERIKRKGLADLALNDEDYDQFVTGLIAEVSGMVEQFIGSKLLNETVTEYRDAALFMDALWLDRRPVSSITAIKNRRSISTAWADVDALDATTYDVDTGGRLMFNLTTLAPGPRALEIIYVAGFALTTAALLTNYPEIVSASERQIAYTFHRRRSPGKASTRVGGQSETTEEEVKLLKSVRQALAPHRRVLVS